MHRSYPSPANIVNAELGDPEISMCIFIATTEINDYAFVLLSNRDEFLDRKTAPAAIWTDADVYGPEDLSKGVHGTWIGVGTSGRFAILVNYKEEDAPEAPFSRGSLPSMFLQSEDTPEVWLEKVKTEHGDNISKCGGFRMMFGDLQLQGDSIAPLQMLSNRVESGPVFVPGGPKTIIMSNGAPGDKTWTKLETADKLLKESLHLHKVDLMENLWRLLDNNTLGENPQADQCKTTIFVPQIKDGERVYGTRTQSVILLDRNRNIQYLERNVQTGEMSSKDWQLPRE